MDKEHFDIYIKERYEVAIAYYDNQAARNKFYYYGLSVITILFSSLTSVLLYLMDIFSDEYFKLIAFLSSTFVSIIMASLSLFNFHEKWTNYRTTCETLSKEIHYYNAKLGDYKTSENPESLFVDRIENLISKEHSKWSMVVKPKEE